MFLQAITKLAYADAATSLLTCVLNYYAWDDKDYLPLHLCIMGLVLQLHKSAITRVVTVLPKVRRTAGDVTVPDTFIQGSPRAARANGTNQWNDQGTNRGPTMTSDRSTDGTNHEHCSNTSSRLPTCLFVQGGWGGRNGRPPSAQVQCARPDRNRGAYLPDITCNACRCPGHVAANCNVLAIPLFIEKYKHDMDTDSKDKMESHWLQSWHGALGAGAKPSCRIMKAYVDLLDITVNNLDKRICWKCWSDGDPGDLDGTTDPDKVSA
jgi:hypothetical protein